MKASKKPSQTPHQFDSPPTVSATLYSACILHSFHSIYLQPIDYPSPYCRRRILAGFTQEIQSPHVKDSAKFGGTSGKGDLHVTMSAAATPTPTALTPGPLWVKDHSYGSLVSIITWFLIITSFLSVFARIGTRLAVVKKLYADDITILVALVCRYVHSGKPYRC